MGKQAELKAGDALLRTIIDEVYHEPLLTEGHIKLLREACDKALKGERKPIVEQREDTDTSWRDTSGRKVQSTESRSDGPRSSAPSGSRIYFADGDAKGYGNFTAACKDAGIYDENDLTELKRQRLALNQTGECEYKGVSFTRK